MLARTRMPSASGRRTVQTARTKVAIIPRHGGPIPRVGVLREPLRRLTKSQEITLTALIGHRLAPRKELGSPEAASSGA